MSQGKMEFYQELLQTKAIIKLFDKQLMKKIKD